MKTKAIRTKVKTTAKASAKTRTMPAGQFKTHCLSIIDEVHNRREELVITKHGKPMARLVPLEKGKEAPDEIFGLMRGHIQIFGDLVEPITDPEDWDTEIFPPEDNTETQ